MSVELISVLIAVLAVGATLGGLILTGNRGLRQDMRQDMAQLESRLPRIPRLFALNPAHDLRRRKCFLVLQ